MQQRKVENPKWTPILAYVVFFLPFKFFIFTSIRVVVSFFSSFFLVRPAQIEAGCWPAALLQLLPLVLLFSLFFHPLYYYSCTVHLPFKNNSYTIDYCCIVCLSCFLAEAARAVKLETEGKSRWRRGASPLLSPPRRKEKVKRWPFFSFFALLRYVSPFFFSGLIFKSLTSKQKKILFLLPCWLTSFSLLFYFDFLPLFFEPWHAQRKVNKYQQTTAVVTGTSKIKDGGKVSLTLLANAHLLVTADKAKI